MVNISNQTFMSELFSDIRSDEACWTCVFSEPSDSQGSINWKGQKTYIDSVAHTPHGNAYFAISSLNQKAQGRTLKEFSRLFVLVVDDAADVELEPTYTLQTSAGSRQVGYKLSEPIADFEMATALVKALATAGHVDADTSGNNAVRYCRLPVGYNNKLKYGSEPFACTLEQWNPERTFTVGQLVDGLGLDLTTVSKAPKELSAPIADEILEGGRNAALTSMAGKLRRDGSSEGEIMALLKVANMERCSPPLPHAEVETIARSIGGYAPHHDTMNDAAARKAEYDSFIQAIEESEDATLLVVDVAQQVGSSTILGEALTAMLLKRIAKKAGTTMAALKADAQDHKKIKADRDENHLYAAREVINSFGKENLITCESGVWNWQDSRGVWGKIADREIKQRVHDVSGSKELTSNIVGSITDLTKTESYVARHYFNQSDKLISVANGVLELKDGQWVLTPNVRENFLTTQIPVKFDPQATAPRFDQFLHEIFDGASDKHERIRVIKQGFGYTLMSSCKFERFFMLIGVGANGKSVLLIILSALIGREQTTAVQPSQFEHKFQRAHLDGKLLNCITEIAEGAEIADAQLKSLVSGEMTTAEHKFKDPFDFKPIATHWFGTNHLPHTRDFSEALFRRAILVEFPRTFAEHERDVNLSKHLMAELPGVLNFALEGLKELLTQQAFSVPQSSNELAKGWRQEADQAAQFVDECCERHPLKTVTSNELYREFEIWAGHAGITRKLNRKNFSTRLEQMGLKLTRTSTHRLIQGLAISARQELVDYV